MKKNNMLRMVPERERDRNVEKKSILCIGAFRCIAPIFMWKGSYRKRQGFDEWK